MTVNLAPAQLERLRMGAMIVADQPTVSSLPLEHTDVVAQVCGPLASVAVTQRFGNPFAEPVELAYLFPLPHEAAIVDFELRIGQRVVRGEMQELQAARRTYAEARAEGKRAGLLEQRRPNLFSVELANVQPGETIVATVRYHERLRYDDGSYQFVFPMGLTPKFHADPAEAAAVDAPIAAMGSPIGRVELSLAVDAGGTADDPASPSHAIELTRLDARRFSVRLLGDVLPNKDFVLRYAVADETLRAAAWTTPGDGGSTVLVTALPPRLTDETEPAPREFLFVIDRSGSMSGGPLDQARNALRACLRALGPQDTFAIQAFDDQIEWLAAASDKAAQGAPAASPVTQAAVEQADRWLAGIDARGGTDILGALEAALHLPADPERQRYVVFLTDGAVSAEEAALSRVERHLGQMRLFTFGIGPSVNRSLLARMAERGRGTAEFLQLDEDIETAIVRFQDRVAYPVLQDIALSWQGATAWDIYPDRLPDLYNGQPLELVARFQSAGAGKLVITGRRDREPIRLEVDLPPGSAAAAEPMIANAWARARVAALLDAIRDDAGKTGALRGEIIGLAIQHRLVTPYTAFVAVDSEVTNGAEDTRRVTIAQPLPEGLDIDGFGGMARAITSAGAGGVPLPISAPAPARAPGVPSGTRPAAPPAPPTSGAPAKPSLFGGLFRDRKQSASRQGQPAAEKPDVLAREAEEAESFAPGARGRTREEADRSPAEPAPDMTSSSFDKGGTESDPFALNDLGLSDDEIAAPREAPRDDRTLGLQELSIDAIIQAPRDEIDADERERQAAESVDETLRWLARQQNVAGSWGAGAEEIEMTAAALLAFIRAGHTTRSGHYRRQLARALKWLRSAEARGITWAARARARALAEMAAAIGDSDLQQAADAASAPWAGEPAPQVAAALATLDDLRSAALIRPGGSRAGGPLDPELLRNDRGGLARIWQAALTA